MKILFLDQSGQLGGAELSLLDVVKPYQDSCLICLFAEGPFRKLLEQQHIPVQVLNTQPIQVNKESSIIQSLGSISSIAPLSIRVAKIASKYDLIYANTQKAIVVGALASFLSRRPLVYHLRDILSADHFSRPNRRVAVALANRFASLVIANSKATKAAFVEAGGHSEIAKVVYNGFDPEKYAPQKVNRDRVKQQFGLDGRFVVGHFSRLSPWKGQHILLEALVHCPNDITAIFVGKALFGEQDYAEQLDRQVAELGLKKRVRFLGFHADIVPLMTACDLVVHTSTSSEPFGRVIVEAMLCGRPVIAAEAGGAVELVEKGKTGWLVPPGNPQKLAEEIVRCLNQPEQIVTIARNAQIQASQRFHLKASNQKISQLLCRAVTQMV